MARYMSSDSGGSAKSIGGSSSNRSVRANGAGMLGAEIGSGFGGSSLGRSMLQSRGSANESWRSSLRSSLSGRYSLDSGSGGGAGGVTTVGGAGFEGSEGLGWG